MTYAIFLYPKIAISFVLATPYQLSTMVTETVKKQNLYDWESLVKANERQKLSTIF